MYQAIHLAVKTSLTPEKQYKIRSKCSASAHISQIACPKKEGLTVLLHL